MSAVESDIKTLFRYRFGNAEFDETRFELRVAGLAVHVERKPLEVLALLLHRAGEVVTKEEMLLTVWAGRPSVETVVTNALTKLRDALGTENAALVVTQPRVGYRLTGTVERVAMGRTMTSRIRLSEQMPVPLRPDFQLESLLNSSRNSEVWVARHTTTNERRVYKFSSDGERLSTLKREVTLSRVLKETLGQRNDLVCILDWNFEIAPYFIECEFGGDSLKDWAHKDETLKQLTQSQRINLFLKIADVVAAAHDVGVLHKDIKPSNILIVPGGNDEWQIRLTDFGSARLLVISAAHDYLIRSGFTILTLRN
jgi:non-specific serine/threonine protein kinase